MNKMTHSSKPNVNISVIPNFWWNISRKDKQPTMGQKRHNLTANLYSYSKSTKL